MSRKQRKTSYVEIYHRIKKNQLNSWLLFVFLIFVTLPNIAVGLVSSSTTSILISIFGVLLLIQTIRNLRSLSKQKKELFSNPQEFGESSINTISNWRQMFWFNKL